MSSFVEATIVTCDDITAKVNQDFEVTVHCVPSTWVKAFEARISFNASIIKANFVRDGNFFKDYQVFKSPGLGVVDNMNGSIKNIYALIIGIGNVSSPGNLFVINFTGLMNGSSPVVFDMMLLTNESKYLTDVNTSDGLVTIDGYMSPDEQNNEPGFNDEPNSNPPKDVDPLSQWTGNIVMVLIIVFVIFFLFSRILG